MCSRKQCVMLQHHSTNSAFTGHSYEDNLPSIHAFAWDSMGCYWISLYFLVIRAVDKIMGLNRGAVLLLCTTLRCSGEVALWTRITAIDQENFIIPRTLTRRRKLPIVAWRWKVACCAGETAFTLRISPFCQLCHDRWAVWPRFLAFAMKTKHYIHIFTF